MGMDVSRPDAPHRLEVVRQAISMAKGPLGGALNDRPISQRIGKRDAQLDDVTARTLHLQDQRNGRLEVGISGSNERNECLLPGASESLKRLW